MRLLLLTLLLGCSPAAESSFVADAAATPEVKAVCNACSTELSGDTPPAGWVCVRELAVELVHLDGRAAAGVTAMSCSRGLCMATESDARGEVRVEPCSFVLEPTFRVVGFDRYVSFAFPLRNPTESFTFRAVPVTPLPSTGVPFGDKVSMNGVTIELGGIDLDPFGPYADFRAVPIDRVMTGFDQGLGLARLYALGPQNAKLDPPAKLSLPNADAWPSGTGVEIWLHNVDLPKTAPVPMGKWWKAATGTVDGDHIVTEDGQGIPLLTVLGVRRI